MTAWLVIVMPAAATARSYEAMRSIDLHVAAVAYRLSTANAPLCATRAPATGLVLHAIDQYPVGERDAIRHAFGFAAPVAVEAVVPGSPAARAGVRPGEGVLAIDGKALPVEIAAQSTSATRDAALAMIGSAEATRPVTLRLAMDGIERTVALAPAVGCDVRVEVALTGGAAAQAGVRTIRIGAALPLRYDDEALAVIVAHELAHVVLGDAARSAQGRTAGQQRAVEDAADRLSVVLLYNAGVDPASAARFWLAHGREIEPHAVRHRPPRERAALLAAAAALIPPGAARPYRPPDQ